VGSVDFEFSPDQEMLRDSVRRFLADRAPIAYVRAMYDDERGTTADVWNGLADLGITGILTPEAHGGLGLGMVDMGVVLEEMGRALHPGPFLSSAVTAATLADAEVAPLLASGEATGTAALFEPDARHSWSTPTVRSTRDGSGWTLSGRKVHVSDGVTADVVLVAAATDDVDLAVFAVDRGAAGMSAELTETVDGSRKEATLDFAATPARLVEGADLALAVDRTMTALVVDGVGAASAALEISLAYAKERVQFDRPIGSFQAIQHLCADMLRDIELARAGAYYALWACDRADPATRHAAATMAKAWASDALARVGASCIQIHGGIGFTWEHDAHLFHKRLLTLQHAFGGSAVHLEELARIVLD